MEISQLLNTIGASPASPNGKGVAADSSGFARIFQQAGTMATPASAPGQGIVTGGGGKTPAMPASLLGGGLVSEGKLGDADLLTELGLGELDEEALADPALLAELETALQAMTGAPIAGEPAELASLAQHVAQALGAGALGDRPINDAATSQRGTQPLGNIQPLDSGASLDLAAIRQRLDLIAGAQRGDGATSPQLLSATAANSPQSVTAEPTVASLGGRRSDATSQRHQQLTALGMQNIAGQQQEQALQTGNVQPNTFAEAVATVSGHDTPLPVRSGSDSSGNQALPLGSSSTGGTAAPMTGQLQGANTPAQVLGAPLASAQWQQGLGQQLVSLHQRGAQKVELHLRPAELGPLTVSLKVDDQLAQAQFFSANPQVRAAVEQAIPQLREALEESGIQLGEAMVGEHQQRDDGNSRSQGRSALASGHGTVTDGAQGDVSLATETPRSLNIGLDGQGVDLYA